MAAELTLIKNEALDIDPTIQPNRVASVALVTPIRERLAEPHEPDVVVRIRHGINVQVVDREKQQTIYDKDVWNSGRCMPIRPFFALRQRLVARKAQRMVGQLNRRATEEVESAWFINFWQDQSLEQPSS